VLMVAVVAVVAVVEMTGWRKAEAWAAAVVVEDMETLEAAGTVVEGREEAEPGVVVQAAAETVVGEKGVVEKGAAFLEEVRWVVVVTVEGALVGAEPEAAVQVAVAKGVVDSEAALDMG
jgi:hypothetical protein